MGRKSGGCAPFWDGELSPHLTHCVRSRGLPTCHVSSWFRPTICPQCTNVTDRQDRERTDSIGRTVFSEPEFTFTFAICYRCPSAVVCLSSETFVCPTQAVQIFGNISTALGTLAVHWHTLKISRRSSRGNPSAGGVKHKSGSQV